MTTKRTDPLTADEQMALELCRSEWLSVGLSTEPADRPEAEAAVKDLYAVMGWREPMVIWMESPLGGAVAAAWFESIGKESNKSQLWDQLWDQLWGQLRDQLGDQLGGQLGGQLRSQLRDQLGDQLRDQLRGQLWGQLGDQLGGQLRDQLRSQLWDQLWDQLGDQLWGQLGGQLRGQLRSQLRGQLGDQLWGQLRGQLGGQLGHCYWGQHDAYWIAWLRFAREVGVKYDKPLDDGLEALSRITRSCGWWWPREGVVIFTERHGQLFRHPDGSGRLHNEEGPAISYPDGYELYAWRGLRVPKEAITDKAWLTTERIAKEPNAELRRAFMEIYGQGRYMADCGAELIDEVHEPPFLGLIDAKLWRMPNPGGGEELMCIELRNSTPEPDGSWKRYSFWCHPQLRPLLDDGELGEPQELSALNALASTYGMRGEDYCPAAES